MRYTIINNDRGEPMVHDVDEDDIANPEPRGQWFPTTQLDPRDYVSPDNVILGKPNGFTAIDGMHSCKGSASLDMPGVEWVKA